MLLLLDTYCVFDKATTVVSQLPGALVLNHSADDRRHQVAVPGPGVFPVVR